MINYEDEYYEEFPEEKSEIILNELIDFINNKGEGSISDYILDFCETNNYRVEEIAYIIAENKTFKNILKQDCLYRGILHTENDSIDEW